MSNEGRVRVDAEVVDVSMVSNELNGCQLDIG